MGSTVAPPILEDTPRLIGRVGPSRGARVVIIGGVHGNEPAGVEAARRLLDELSRESSLGGEVVALIGNRSALAEERRFLRRDLNRLWTDAEVSRVLAQGPDPECPESREQHSLLRAIMPWLAEPRRFHLIDLHTASAVSPPFALVGDTLRNRWFARKLPLPILLGLEEQLEGSLLEWVGRQGHLTLGVEGGEHGDPDAVEHCVAACWLALASARVVPASHPRVTESEAHLRRVSAGLPGRVEVRHRHALRPFDEFQMEPDFPNFRRIRRGEILARDRRGPIRSAESGFVLLPLYQGLGDDGFFLGRAVPALSSGLILGLRCLGLDRLLPLLSGVRRDRTESGSLFLDAGTDELLTRELLAAFGYRRRERGPDGRLRLVRRLERPRRPGFY